MHIYLQATEGAYQAGNDSPGEDQFLLEIVLDGEECLFTRSQTPRGGVDPKGRTPFARR